jgi:N6-L-threonylcarbamoyladenine synthase
MIVLGIESSCDETAASVCRDGEILSSVVWSQEVHDAYGGVVPELASREHDSRIYGVVEKSLKIAKITFNDLNSIAVTYGPGLLGSLIVGLNFAKGLSVGLNLPFIGINHLEGHLYSSFISGRKINFPFICFLVTGGHTQIWEVKGFDDYILHSTSVDDAAGEAFDKGARILGLGYPGGPEIEKKAKNGNPSFLKFTIPIVKNNPYNFSFSGIKTAILYKTQVMSENEIKLNLHHIASSYQEVIIDTLLDRLNKVIKLTGLSDVSITGGVAANKRFRHKVGMLEEKKILKCCFPDIKYCTDNAAMIAKVGFYKQSLGINSSLTLQATPNLRLDES